MTRAGLQNVAVLRSGDSNPYAYGEWLGAPGKPTVFLYAHHDVQPVNDVGSARWDSPPWQLTRRDGRLFGRGSADDKGAITAQLGAVAAWLKTKGSLPVNVKVLVEGEEEVGSRNLLGFFKEHRDRLLSDVIVVCDTENVDTGIPSLTYSLRGIVAVDVEVECAAMPVHSGMAGGALADAALALSVLLSRFYWGDGPLPIPGYYDRVRPTTDAERRAFASPARRRGEVAARFRHPPGSALRHRKGRPRLRTDLASACGDGDRPGGQCRWRRRRTRCCRGHGPSSVARIVPDQDPKEVFEQLKAVLTKDPPWGVHVKVTPSGPPVPWWMTDPQRSGIRGRDRVAGRRLRQAAGVDRLWRDDRFRGAVGRSVQWGPCSAAGHRGSAQQRRMRRMRACRRRIGRR